MDSSQVDFKEKDDDIIVYKNVSYKFGDIFYISREPVWYITVLTIEYLSIYLLVYPNVDDRCHSLGWYKSLKVLEVLYGIDVLVLIDIILTLGGKFTDSVHGSATNLNSRPLWIIIIEFLALVPYRWLISFIYPSHLQLLCFISVTKSIRYVRIWYFFNRVKNLVHSSTYVRIIEMICNLSVVILLAGTIYCNISCNNNHCFDESCYDHSITFRLTGELMSTSQHAYQHGLAWNLLVGFSKLIVIFFVFNITMALISIELIHLYTRQVSFVNEFHTILGRKEIATSSKFLKNRVTSYYNDAWQTRGGYTRPDGVLSILTQCLRNEVMIDISWLAYKHSSLFKGMNLAFLRELSKYMKQEHKVPGEIIWDRAQVKEKMIYVVSGTIQLLSEEDGESPVLAFTSGTCLGESSLLVSYKSRSKVRSKEYCDLYCLYRRDLLTISKKYPKEVLQLHTIIMARFDSAKELKRVADKTKQGIKEAQDNLQLDVYTIVWLKNTLHKLMSKDKESARRHEFQNIYLVSEVNESCLNKLLFSARYLSSLAIAERIDVDMDTVFVKPTCPCILRPFSFVVNLWEVIILAITVFISFVIPYASFIMTKPPVWFTWMVCTCTFIFWIDLYIQLSVGVVQRGNTSNKFVTTAKTKMQTMGFWVDFFSCIPCEILTCITIRESYNTSRAVMYTNRLAKLWRVNRLFRFWERIFSANFVLIRFVKFSWINLYATFIFWCLLYSKTPRPYLFLAVETVTGTAVVGVNKEDKDISTINFIVNIVAWIITLFMRSNIASAFVLVNLSKFQAQVFCEDVINTLKSNGLCAAYLNRLNIYLTTQWNDNRCLQLTRPKSDIPNLPRVLFYDIFVHNFKDILLNQPFFQILPLRCVYDIAGACSRTYICPPNDVILYAGDISDTVIIIHCGTYEVRDNKNQSLGCRSTEITVNLLEATLRTPAANTYVAVTYCRMSLLDIKQIENIFAKYDHVWTDYKETLKQCKKIKQSCLKLSEVHESEYEGKVSIETNDSFYHFGYNLPIDSFEEYDYYIPFDKIYPFCFLRFLLFRSVILPEGKFLFIWESVRSLCAVASNILHFVMPIVIHPKYVIILVGLDFTAVVDIYVRLHVAYYNSDGILVKHPFYTAKYYITHGLFIDVLGIFPFSLLVQSQSLWFYVFASNRLLQLHRYVQFFLSIRNQTLKPLGKRYIIAYIPLSMVLINFYANWLITSECVYVRGHANINNYIGINCSNNSILNTPRLTRPVTKMKAHTYGCFIAAKLLLNMDVESYSLRSNNSYVLVAMISLMGYYFQTVFIGKIFTFFTIRRATLLSYQEAMRVLRSYLKRMCVNPSLIQLIINNYEFKWSCVKGRNIHKMIAPFYDSFCTDALYMVYGKSLYNSSIFTNKTAMFYRNLIKYMKYDIIKTGGYLTTINDVTENLHILYNGRADVLSPDGTVLDLLMPGSIFGNLQNTNLSRLRVSVVAACHVEVLSVPAETFYKILKYYREMHEQFDLLKAKYVGYIPAEKAVSMDQTSLKLSSTLGAFILNKTFNPNSKLIEYWNIINLVYTCYIGIIIDLYQFGSIDYSLVIFFFQYSSDLLYALQFFMKERTAYEDESGMLVTDLKLIRTHNRKNKLLFVITIASLIPLDIPILIFAKRGIRKFQLYSLGRLNRLLRLTYIFQFFDNFANKLNINLYLTNFTYIFMWTTLFFCCLASIIGFTSCVSTTTADSGCNTTLELDWIGKFGLYSQYFYIAISWFTHSNSYRFHPEGTLPLMVYTFALLACITLNMVCLGQFFSFISQCNFQRFKYRDFTDKLMMFMEREDVSVSLIERVSNYIEMLWFRMRGVVFPELLKEAPLYLQDIIMYDAFAHLIVDHPIFRKCHRDCLRQVIQKMKIEIHFAGDYVQFKDTIDETMYFVFSGEVNVIDENELAQDIVVKKLGRNRSFGVLQGIYNRYPHMYTYLVSMNTILITLNKRHWIYLLDYFPASKEQIYDNAEIYYGL